MKTALYQQIYDALRLQIETGQLAVGSKIPSLDDLAAAYGVSTITARKALDMLSMDGLVLRRPRIGTIVISDEPIRSSHVPEARMLIGCVLTNYDDTFGTELLSGILDAAEGQSEVIVRRSLGDLDREECAITDLINVGVQGLIVLPTSSQQIPTAVLTLTAQHFPMVIVDRSFNSVPISAVSSDNFGGAKMATEHLIELGHRHIGWMAPPESISTVVDRHAGYVRAQAEHRIAYLASQELTTLDSVVPGTPDDMMEDLARIDGFLDIHPEVTAYVVSQYNIALLLATACRRRGIVIGSDISVVCFDHPVTLFDPDRFTFTHVQQNQTVMADIAVEQLMAEIAQPGCVQKHTVEVELILGDSSAPIRTVNT